MFFRVLISCLSILIASNLSGQITESFDSWIDASYGGVSNTTLASGIWESNNSLAGTTNPRTGTKCVRFNDDSGNNEYLEYQGTDGNGKDNGLGTISFWYRHWDADGSNVQFQVQYNQSGGGWNNIGGVISVTSTTYSQFTASPNILGDDILVRVISIDDEERMCIDDFEMDDYTVPCVSESEPTTASSSLNISNIDCYSMDLSWTSGNGSTRIVVASLNPISGTPTDQTTYSASASFGAGSTIAAGEFVVYNGTGNSFTLSGLTTSTTYYFAIFEYNVTTTNCTENYFTTSLTGNNTTTFCANTDPEITGILIDACGGSEGVNEFITFNNGSSNLDIDDLKVTFPFISPYCNSGCGTNTWVTNATYTAQLNTTAGCAGLFVEADPIPANAGVIIFTGSSPTYNFDFTGLCGSGPYYVVYANNTGTGGRFGNYDNDCTKYRTTIIDFDTISDTVTYQPCMLTPGAADGDYVAFAADGTPTYSNDGCTPTATLPIELLYFKGKSIAKGNLLEWMTSAEINNDFFTLEKSNDAVSFKAIGIVNGAGNSITNINYQFTDDNITNNTNYYRLKQTDFNGNYSYSNTIVLSSNLTDNLFYNPNSKQLEIGDIKNGTIAIYNLQGQLVKSIKANNSSVSLNLSNGMYLITVKTGSEIFSKKIVIN